MSILFRFHRASLDDSLKTAISVESKAELIMIIYKELSLIQLDMLDMQVRFQYAEYDDRCGWDTYYVFVGPDIYGFIAGMSNGEL